jgi:hypothetical protein
MKYLKASVISLVIFFIVWGSISFFGPIFMQDGDRKKLIFRPISYYEDISSTLGIIIGLALAGYFFYKFIKETF